MSCEMLIRRMNGDDAPVWFDPTDGRPIVPHGFRSTARDWTGECTAFPRDVCEMALAHALESKVEAAYRRGDLFEKRRRLMDAWSEHCATVRIDGTNVVPMRATG
jgi:integrase